MDYKYILKKCWKAGRIAPLPHVSRSESFLRFSQPWGTSALVFSGFALSQSSFFIGMKMKRNSLSSEEK